MTEIIRRLESSALAEHPPGLIWDVLADFGGVAKWAPRMLESRLDGALSAGVGTRRVMRHFWGFRIEETVIEWCEGRSLSFRLDRAPYPMRDVFEHWLLEPAEGGTRIRTVVTYGTACGRLGAALDRVLIRFVVAREMKLSLRSLQHYIAYRVRKGLVTSATPQPADGAESSVSSYGPQ